MKGEKSRRKKERRKMVADINEIKHKYGAKGDFFD